MKSATAKITMRKAASKKKLEECVHFFPDSKLATGDIQVCNRSAIVQDNRVSVDTLHLGFHLRIVS